ncbi:MAG: alpha-glucosidase C-terminal domain-containing protein, partial [Bacilli bacterium]
HDVSIINQYQINVIRNHHKKEDFIAFASLTSRDNARSLMQWDNKPYGGFSLVKPWNIIGDYRKINVKSQINNPRSIFAYYQNIIKIRLNPLYKDIFVYGTYDLILNDHPQVYAYLRRWEKDTILVLANMKSQKVLLPKLDYQIKSIILSNYQREFFSQELLPFEAIVLQIEEE